MKDDTTPLSLLPPAPTLLPATPTHLINRALQRGPVDLPGGPVGGELVEGVSATPLLTRQRFPQLRRLLLQMTYQLPRLRQLKQHSTRLCYSKRLTELQ